MRRLSEVLLAVAADLDDALERLRAGDHESAAGVIVLAANSLRNLAGRLARGRR